MSVAGLGDRRSGCDDQLVCLRPGSMKGCRQLATHDLRGPDRRTGERLAIIACSGADIATSTAGGGSLRAGPGEGSRTPAAATSTDAGFLVGIGRDDVEAQHDVRAVEPSDGRKLPIQRIDRAPSVAARSARRRRTADPAPPPAGRRRGSSRGSRAAPRGRPGNRLERRPGCTGSEVALQLDHVLREAVDVADQGPAQRVGLRRIAPGRGPARDRSGRGRAIPGCRTARRSPAARGSAA